MVLNEMNEYSLGPVSVCFGDGCDTSPRELAPRTRPANSQDFVRREFGSVTCTKEQLKFVEICFGLF